MSVLTRRGSPDRIRSHVRNIALLRVSADDARADRKLQGLEEEPDGMADAHVLDDHWEENDGPIGDNIGSQDCYDAFLGVLSAVRKSEIKDMPVSLALRCLDEEARAVDLENEDSAVLRGRQFYAMFCKTFRIHLSGVWVFSARKKSMSYSSSNKKKTPA